MLPRAARRKVQRDTLSSLRPFQQQLSLPWLCPALYRPQLSARRYRTLRRPPSQSSAAASLLAQNGGSQTNRHLATAASTAAAATMDSYNISNAFPRDPPPLNLPLDSLYGLNDDRKMSDLREFNPSANIIINDVMASRPLHYRSHNGIGGTIDEMLETFKTCLAVGKHDRAVSFIERLEKVYQRNNLEILTLHNAYLKSFSFAAISSRSTKDFSKLQRWFEVKMKGGNVEPNETTYALMIKASLHLLHGSKQERTVRRYFEMARDAELQQECLNSFVLSDSELGRVTKICEYAIDTDSIVPEKGFIPDTQLLDVEQADSSDTITESSLNLKSDQTRTPTEILSTGQKGLGLQALKNSLSLFSNTTSALEADDFSGTAEEKSRALALTRQLQLEKDVVTAAIERWRAEHDEMKKLLQEAGLSRKSLNVYMWQWTAALRLRIKNEIKLADESEKKTDKNDDDNARCTYGPFLHLIPPEKLAAVSILSVLNVFASMPNDSGGSTNRFKVGSLAIKIGTAIEEESIADTHFKKKELASFSRGHARRAVRMLRSSMANQKQESTPSEPEALDQFSHSHRVKPWGAATRARVGAALLLMLTEEAKTSTEYEDPETHVTTAREEAAFVHTYIVDKGKRQGVVCINQYLSKVLATEPSPGMLAKHLPMVSEPRHWTGVREGGFLEHHVPFVRSKALDSRQRIYASSAAERGDLDQVFKALDVLSKTSWKIHRGVFDVMVEAWNSGEECANLPAANPEFNYPEKPESEDPIELRRWSKEVQKLENEKGGLHSTRCFQNLQLEIARAFVDEKFYMPHNIDFRGRAYPIPPYLNHMGADNARGLLVFGKGKKLGQNGLRWLKIHLANVWGYDKASLQEREDFTMEHLDDIYDSATKGLHGRKWWLEAEDPWQCLAACMELKAALDSPDPHAFVSHLPVAQDGSCNGLQHYAALGGDPIGAQQVNLEPGDRPSDVYTGTAELVKADVAEDAAAGNPIAEALVGKVTRKVVKQTVMTNVYGVTAIGARAQVYHQLKDLYPDFPDIPGVVTAKLAAAYIAKKIFKALATMFTGAHEIQYWLAECASRISQSLSWEQVEGVVKETHDAKAAEEADPIGYRYRRHRKENLKGYSIIPESKLSKIESRFRSAVVWTTPLKLPVVQPYRAPPARRIGSQLQKISIFEPSDCDPVLKRKQVQAFPPNFVHSLDATHMALSALKSDELGLTFASVHDSFWTHAGDVDIMNRVLRDAFIKMHSEDIIGRLAAEFNVRYKPSLYLAQVHRTSNIGKRICKLRMQDDLGSLQSSKRKKAELLLEYERLKLLRSNDPEEVKKGKAIITPGSLFEEFASESDLDYSGSRVHATLGEVADLEADDDMLLDTATSPQVDVFNDEEDVVEAAMDSELLATNETLDDLEVEKKVKKKRVLSVRRIFVWLPMEFPPLPNKGNFDVSRLKDSQYFFS
ncbi:MAG: DNA-directed RNA polymerase [Cirrosporium novae-zelandiae]|nr:MAG: DNA-directed RNA polymerase [Cirrosporium novae-zelandiae]